MPLAADTLTMTLNNGLTIPRIGLGTCEVREATEIKHIIDTALACGYRLIDTAMIYGNEQSVGEAVRDCGIAREEIFVTTKLWNTDHGYEPALRAYDASLRLLGMDYVDLYLIHWPAPHQGMYSESWRALEKLYQTGRVRAIGVSNFKPHHLETLQENWEIVPAVNQIELHPRFQQIETRQYCEEHDIAVESYSPLQRSGDLLREPVIQELADKYGKTSAQIILHWHVQEGMIVIPKNVTAERIRDSIDIFDFEMHEDDIELIRELNRDQRLLTDPDTFG